MIKKVTVKGKQLLKRTFATEYNFDQLSILYSCNGSGKSSLLNAIQRQEKGHEVEIEGNFKGIAFYHNETTIHTKINAKSEGERVMISVLEFIELAKLNKNLDVIIFDEVDNGLSVEHVNIIMEEINKLLLMGKQVIFSCNSYHPIYLSGEFLNMMTGNKEDCIDYMSFCTVAIDSRKKLVKKGMIPETYKF